MNIKKVTAIINEMQLDNVANALCEHGVKGFTIHPVSGRGSYCNTYCKDGLVTHKQIEVYTHEIYSQQALGQPLTASITGGTKNEYLYT